MSADLTALAAAASPRGLPSAGTLVDMIFAYGAIALLAALVWRQHREP
jgi:hypothetical protein